MATWQLGPFDNDGAVEWCGVLEAAAPERRADVVRHAIEVALVAGSALSLDEAVRAVAAAATVLQSITGVPSSSAYAPRFLLGRTDIRVSESLRDLAAQALDVILADDSTWRLRWADDIEEEDALAIVEKLRLDLVSAAIR